MWHRQLETRASTRTKVRVPLDRRPKSPATQLASCWYAHPCTVRTDNTLKVRFTATLGEEPDINVELA